MASDRVRVWSEVLLFTAQVPGELAYRDAVGSVVRAVCRHVEAASDCEGLEWRMVSAFNEAFNNVAEHAYSPARRGEVFVRVRVDEVELVLEIADQGEGFDYDAVAASEAPAFEDLDRGGMGLYIIRQSVTAVTYERGATNRLTLKQSLAECRARAASKLGRNDEGSQC